MSDNEEKKNDEYLQQMVTQLSERFDVVQIFVSRQDGTGTTARAIGRGNWYARKGMAQEFVDKDFAQEIAVAIKRTKPE